MKAHLITWCILLIYLSFVGCSKGSHIDEMQQPPFEHTDPEHTEGKNEDALEYLEKVEQFMDSLSSTCQNANELVQYLKDIKTIEGVEDAWAEDASIFWIKIKDGGLIGYHYVPEKMVHDADIENLKTTLQTKALNNDDNKNVSVCIINQLSEDDTYARETRMCEEIASLFELAGFDVNPIVEGSDFTIDFLLKQLPNYRVVLLVTHGTYRKMYGSDKYSHCIYTGQKVYNKTEREAFKEKWNSLEVAFLKRITRKHVLFEELSTYVVVSEELIKNAMTEFKEENSILFNVACQSLMGDNSLWNILSEKGLGSYLGFDQKNSIGISSAASFFTQMIAGKTVSEAYDEMPDYLKNEVFQDAVAINTHLQYYPRNCDITLYDTPRITEGDAIDLGLSVKWRSRNLGAGNYLELGNSYGNHDKYELRKDFPEFKEKGECNIAGTKYDYAYTALGGGWRMPTLEEWKELRDKCEWHMLIQNEVPGFQVIGPNKNSIFLPTEFSIVIENAFVTEVMYCSSDVGYLGGIKTMFLISDVAFVGGISMGAYRIEEMQIIDTAFIRPVHE